MTILGISIGTTRTGVCVIRDGVLLDRSIHNYQEAWSEHKLRAIVNRYKQYVLKRNAAAIVVKIPPLKKHTPAIRRLMRRVERLAKEEGCEFDLITKSEIKHVTGARSTAEIIRYATIAYPELAAIFEKGSPNDHGYYKKLFEAIVSAHIFKTRLEARARQLASTIE